METNKFERYLYCSDATSSTQVVDTFAKGIRGNKSVKDKNCFKLNDIVNQNSGFSLIKLDENDDLNNETIKNLNKNGVNCVYVVKIPKKFMGNVAKEGYFCSPMPLIRTDVKTDRAYLDGSFIQGAVLKNGQTIENHGFMKTYNPNGLQYTDEQISIQENVVKNNTAELSKPSNWVDYMETRRKYEDFAQLEKFDSNNHSFENAMQQYSQEFEFDSYKTKK